jgi:hypothetical protein
MANFARFFEASALPFALAAAEYRRSQAAKIS